MSKGLVGYTPGASGSWAEEEPRTLLSSHVPAKGQSALVQPFHGLTRSARFLQHHTAFGVAAKPSSIA